MGKQAFKSLVKISAQTITTAETNIEAENKLKFDTQIDSER